MTGKRPVHSLLTCPQISLKTCAGQQTQAGIKSSHEWVPRPTRRDAQGVLCCGDSHQRCEELTLRRGFRWAYLKCAYSRKSAALRKKWFHRRHPLTTDSIIMLSNDRALFQKHSPSTRLQYHSESKGHDAINLGRNLLFNRGIASIFEMWFYLFTDSVELEKMHPPAPTKGWTNARMILHCQDCEKQTEHDFPVCLSPACVWTWTNKKQHCDISYSTGEISACYDTYCKCSSFGTDRNENVTRLAPRRP